MKAHKNEDHSEETRISLLEQSINHINETLIRFEKRFDKMDSRFDKVDASIEKVRDVSWSQFRWLLATILGLILTVSGIFLKGHIG